MTKIKVVEFDEFYTFVVDDLFLFEIIYYSKILFKFLMHWNSNCEIGPIHRAGPVTTSPASAIYTYPKFK